VSARALLALPNLLSLARFPLAAAFVMWDSPPARIAVLGAASITDLLDGWLARRVGMATRFGALLDPIADKSFVLTALAVFAAQGELSLPFLFLILSRDIATAAGFVVAWRTPGLDPGAFRARWMGKLTTVLQLVALLVLIVRPHWLPRLIPFIAASSALAIADYTLSLARSRQQA